MRCIPPRRSSRRPDVLPAGAQRRQALSCELTFGGQHGEALLVEAAAEVRAEQRAERPAVAFRVWYSAGLHVNSGQDHDQCRGDGHQESDPVRVDRQPGGVGDSGAREPQRISTIRCGHFLRAAPRDRLRRAPGLLAHSTCPTTLPVPRCPCVHPNSSGLPLG